MHSMDQSHGVQRTILVVKSHELGSATRHAETFSLYVMSGNKHIIINKSNILELSYNIAGREIFADIIPCYPKTRREDVTAFCHSATNFCRRLPNHLSEVRCRGTRRIIFGYGIMIRNVEQKDRIMCTYRLLPPRH